MNLGQTFNKTNSGYTPNINPLVNSIPRSNFEIDNRLKKKLDAKKLDEKKFDTWGFIFKYLLPFLIIGGIIGYVLYLLWPSITSIWNYFVPPAPKPCGGSCPPEYICKDNRCIKDCKTKKYWPIGGDGICCDTEGATSTEEIVNNECLKKCSPGSSRCGRDCYMISEETCIGDKICKIGYVASKQESSGRISDKCCERNEKGEQTFPLSGECVVCQPSRKCGRNCCPSITDGSPIDPGHINNPNPGSQCVDPSGAQFCCNPDFVGIDSNTGVETCCPQELCGGMCCSGNRKCNKKAVGGPKCQVSCGDGSKQVFCSDASSLCVNDEYFGAQCYPKACGWGRTMYVPNAVYDNTSGTGVNARIIPVCSYDNKLGYDDLPNLAVSDMGEGQPLKSDTIIELDPKEDRSLCKSLPACLGKIQEKGMEHVIHNNELRIMDYTDPKSQVNIKVCKGQSNCSQLLPTLEELSGKDRSYRGQVYRQDANKNITTGYYDKTSCPAKDVGGNDSLSCCYNPVDRTFNGKVCPDSQQCYMGAVGGVHHCAYPGMPARTYNLDNCNGKGKLNINKNDITGCKCDVGYAGKSCQYSDANSCNSNGIVSHDKVTDVPICTCNDGYEGSNCGTVTKITPVTENYGYNHQVLHIIAGPGLTFKNYSVFTIDATDENARCTERLTANTKSMSFGRCNILTTKLYVIINASYNKGGKTSLTLKAEVSVQIAEFQGFTPVVLSGYDSGRENYTVRKAEYDTFGRGTPAVIKLGIPL